VKPCNFRPNALAALFFALTSLAQAQSYPSKPLHLIVPYPPGGGTDIVARAVAQKLFENTGQPMVIENKPGASELIGTDALAKSAPDGYTLGLVTNTFSINESLQHKLPYKGVSDFIPVTMLIATPLSRSILGAGATPQN
jgi:tripartite-type tricarboxylate transporter receptor subunit TctC